MRILQLILLFTSSLAGMSQCFLDSNKIQGSSNLIDVEEKTSVYYCLSRSTTEKDTIPKEISVGIKQYLFATIGNSLYKKLKLKGIEIVDWSDLDQIFSSEPSKVKCRGIAFIYTYALVFEDWIEYEIFIPVNSKGKVVSKGFHEPKIDIEKELKVNTYCDALKLLELEIGEKVATIDNITIEYNPKIKSFDWIFTQEEKRVPVKRKIQDLQYDTVEKQYFVWTVSALDGQVHEAFIVEED